MSLEELRDIVIVVYGVLGILVLLVLLVVLVALWFAVRGLSRTVQELLRDPVRPALEEAQQTMRNVRGGSEFLMDSAVGPVIRVVSVARGVRKGVGIASGIARRRRR